MQNTARVYFRTTVAGQNLHFWHFVAAQEAGIASPVRRGIHYVKTAPSTALSPNIIRHTPPPIHALDDRKNRKKSTSNAIHERNSRIRSRLHAIYRQKFEIFDTELITDKKVETCGRRCGEPSTNTNKVRAK